MHPSPSQKILCNRLECKYQSDPMFHIPNSPQTEVVISENYLPHLLFNNIIKKNKYRKMGVVKNWNNALVIRNT